MVKIIAHLPAFPNGGKLLSEWAAAKGYQIIDPAGPKSLADFTALADGAVAFAGGSVAQIPGGGWTDEFVSSIPSSVKAVCSLGAGYDGLGKMDRFKAHGLQVSNTPTGVVQATADTGLYLILGAMRNFGRLAASLQAGNWLKGIPLAGEYDGKTLGILGLGGIGAVVRDKVEAVFDFERIQYHNRRRAAPETEKDCKYVSFDELISTSDVILCVLPLNPQTHHILNRDSLAKTKKGVVIVNIGRGPLIDEEALGEALESGHVGGAGLDVYENEPIVNEKLLAAKNTLLLPHVGTHTEEARAKMMKEMIANLDAVIDTGKVVNLVPELR